MNQQSLSISVCKDAHEAIKQGHFYRPPIFKPIYIEKVVVVENGTESGLSTVDLVLVDENGQKYVAMLSGRLIKSIPC